MERVEFIDCEKGDDIIITLSCREGGHFGVEGFMVLRTPKFEFSLMPHERGAHIEWDDDDFEKASPVAKF